MNTLIQSNFNDRNDFFKAINTLRKKSKNKWYSFSGTVNGQYIELKAFGTWLQIFRIDGIDNSHCPDLSVKRFNEILDNSGVK